MLKLKLSNDETEISINLKSAAQLSTDEIMSVVRLANKDGIITSGVLVEPTPPQFMEPIHSPEPIHQPTPKPRPRAIELLNNERYMNTPISEILEPKSVFNRVKVYINCPKCGKETDCTTYEGNSYTKCPDCESKLFNTYATDASLTPDEDGYVYMATTLLKPKQYNDSEGF